MLDRLVSSNWPADYANRIRNLRHVDSSRDFAGFHWVRGLDTVAFGQGAGWMEGVARTAGFLAELAGGHKAESP